MLPTEGNGMRSWGWILLGLCNGCADTAVNPEPRSPEADVVVEEDDGQDDCENQEGELTGRVLLSYSNGDADVIPIGAKIIVTLDNQSDDFPIEVDNTGTFNTELPAGEYRTLAQYKSCFSGLKFLTVNGCDIQVKTFRIMDCNES